MQSFNKHANNNDGTPGPPIKAGDVINFNYEALKSDGSPGTEGSVVVAVANDPTIASVVPNTGIGNSSGSTITMLKAGTVVVTVSSTNETGQSYHTDFEIVIAAPDGPVTDHFNVIEVG